MLVLDVVRHGHADNSSQEGDAGRPLTSEGAEEVRALGRMLIDAGWRPTRVFASPLKRARDTARLLVESLDAAPLIETLLELEPEAEPTEVLAALDAHGVTEGHVLLVSHMPLVSGLCRHLGVDGEAFWPAEMRRIACPEGLTAGRGRRQPVPGYDRHE